MPYKLQEEDGKFYVVNSDTGERKNKKPLSKERANKYMRALYAVEGGAEMGKKEGGWLSGLVETVLKHLPGKHDQKRHGWRFGKNAKEPEDDLDYVDWRVRKYKLETRKPRAKRLSPAAKTGALYAHHPSRGSKGLGVNDKNRSAIDELIARKYGQIKDGRFFLNKNGMKYVNKLLDTDKDASDFYFSINKNKEFSEPSLFIFKQSNGQSRWVTFSSNAYRDRDKEIVSTKALEADCARADKEGDYGPLRWWHVGKPDPFAKLPGAGADIGNCDYNAMHGRILVESGTFKDERIAEAIKSKAQDLQVSIGYFHPLTEPDSEGVFHTIRRFERSLLPRGRASNPWTSMLVVQKEGADMLKEKVQALKALLGGDDELVKTVLDAAEKAEKQAIESGVAFKEDEKSEPDPTPEIPVQPTAELAETKAEDETESESSESESTETAEEDYEPVIGDMSPDEFAGMLAEAMGKALEPYQSEIKSLKTSMKKKDDSEASLREALEAQAVTIKELSSQVAELTGTQPRAAAKAYRASQDEATVIKQDSTVNGKAPTVDPAFRDFAIGK